MKRILCFGDSLTWGYCATADDSAPGRYPAHQRWTGRLAAHFGADAAVVEDGLNGRTTDLDDPEAPYRNGAAALPIALRSQTPLDLVVLMLGTNDSKAYFRRTAVDIAVSLSGLTRQIAGFSGPDAAGAPAPKILLLSPPPVRPDPESWAGRLFEDANARLGPLPGHLSALAATREAGFLDVGRVLTTGGTDGIHFSEANNAALAEAVADAAAPLLA
ncbi:GDSL-type esterase/lipase family protein [Tropicimonas marinistellae]|uniref:GDSL-type esterase/lipase family protein n=1 Tax=Tropicimonas marinistellae TaxID=1739787 RepID=UPI00082B0710|nr:GDSL-type esterase/lipase family protein [Tropicimonas marinistellae]